MPYYTAGDWYMAGQSDYPALQQFLDSGGFAEAPLPGGTSTQGGYHVPRSWGSTPAGPSPWAGPMHRRYRRTNPLNPRALRRAMRRVSGFAKFARKTMTFTKTHHLKKHRRR